MSFQGKPKKNNDVPLPQSNLKKAEEKYIPLSVIG